MEPAIDSLLFAWDGILSAVMREIAQRGLMGWLLFLVPFFLLCELPRYGIPPVVMLWRWLRGSRTAAATAPGLSCSVLLVGYNEQEHLPRAIEHILGGDHQPDEIIVVDDASTDGTYSAVRPYADRGEIRLFRNTAASGRGGRPAVSNYGLAVARGEVVVSIDADTMLEPQCLRRMLAPFADPKVGAVGGNLVVADQGRNLLTSFQAIEYMISIGLYRQWLDLSGQAVMASGALGAFRREALERVGGWDPELAEDADLSTKVRKAGWRLRFSAAATAATEVPSDWPTLLRQRRRWDRGFIRTFYRKHRDILNIRRYGWRRSAELLVEGFFSVLCSLLLVPYLVWLGFYDLRLLVFVLVVTLPLYASLTGLSLATALTLTGRWRQDGWLLCLLPVFPIYGLILRAARIWAYSLELLRIDYEDPFLPQSAWRQAPRW